MSGHRTERSSSQPKWWSRWRAWPVVRHLRMLALRRLTPLHRGQAWGTPVVRYYWAEFLETHRDAVHGRGLEIGTTETLRQYGGAALTAAEALDLAPHSDEVTVCADLARADSIPADQYDCFIVQFTMTVIYDVEAALYHAIRILKPGGVLLVNFASVDYYLYRGLDMGTGAPLYMYWWFTPLHVEETLRRLGLGEGDYEIDVRGNLFTRLAFQMNLMAEELTQQELDHVDPGQPLLICVRVTKPAMWTAEKPTYRDPLVQPSLPPARLDATTGHYGDAY
jgi:SAM-dependent methyltransferase